MYPLLTMLTMHQGASTLASDSQRDIGFIFSAVAVSSLSFLLVVNPNLGQWDDLLFSNDTCSPSEEVFLSAGRSLSWFWYSFLEHLDSNKSKVLNLLLLWMGEVMIG